MKKKIRNLNLGLVIYTFKCVVYDSKNRRVHIHFSCVVCLFLTTLLFDYVFIVWAYFLLIYYYNIV